MTDVEKHILNCLEAYGLEQSLDNAALSVSMLCACLAKSGLTGYHKQKLEPILEEMQENNWITYDRNSQIIQINPR